MANCSNWLFWKNKRVHVSIIAKISNRAWGPHRRIWSRGSMDWTQREPRKNDWRPTFLSRAQASEVSQLFVIWHPDLGCLFWISRLSQTKIRGLWPFWWKRSVWQIKDQLKTNQNSRTYLRTTLPYNIGFYSVVAVKSSDGVAIPQKSQSHRYQVHQ